MTHIFETYFNLNLTKMKKVKLVFGLLMLAVFSLSFVANSNADVDNDSKQTVEKARYKIPKNG